MTDYPPGMTLRPIEQWPLEFTRNRRRSQFSATWSATVKQLDTELRHLGQGRRAPSVLQIAMREQDFRLRDGMPRANAVPEHPGVILNIESRHGELSYPCDTFTRWQDNLRAIAMGLESLRRVERYGITQTGQQYRGWQAIEAKPASTFTADTAEKFLRSLYREEGDGLDLTNSVPQVYRRVKALAHPDRNAGDQSQWDRVEAAATVLRAAGRLP